MIYQITKLGLYSSLLSCQHTLGCRVFLLVLVGLWWVLLGCCSYWNTVCCYLFSHL